MIYDNLIDLDSRDGDKVDTGYPLNYLVEIVKYMKNEYDINELNYVEFDGYCRELIGLNIPFRMDTMNRLCTNNNKCYSWKNRWLMVNGNECKLVMNYMIIRLGDLHYNSEKDRDEIIRNTSIPSTNEILTHFNHYLKAPSKFAKNDKLKIDDIMKIISVIGIDISADLVKEYFLNYTNSLFCYGTKVLEDSEYVDKLREWASEHNYIAKSFHECCDSKRPTLIVIKSRDGWIFGGYTTQSWSGENLFKDDSEAFIFTLKNPHGIIPTKYKKKYDSPYSHYCDPKYGPFFIGGNLQCADLAIIDLCNQEYSCWTQNTGESGFTCQLGFGASLFVNTNDSNKPNMFSVLDYEVYTHI